MSFKTSDPKFKSRSNSFQENEQKEPETKRRSSSFSNRPQSDIEKRRSSYSNYSSIGGSNSTTQADDFATFASTPLTESSDYIRNKRAYPKIGIVKEGFHILQKSNPVSRYNFIIDRYNEDINKVNGIALNRIELCSCLLRFFDLFTWLRRMNYAVFLMIFSYYSYYKWRKYYLLIFQFYSWQRITSMGSANNNFLLVLLSLICNIITILLLIFCFYILLIPMIIMLGIMTYAFILHSRNKGLIIGQELNIYNNMIYDNNLNEEKCEKINEYITILPGGLNDFVDFNYYHELSRKYKKRKQNIPQQFMLYSNYYINEWTTLEKTTIMIIIEISLTTILGSIFFVYV